MAKFLAIILSALILFSCANNDSAKHAELAKDTPSSNSKDTASPAANPYSKIDKDSVTISPFEIEVTLSPKAAERIKDRETIIVGVSFTGTPKKDADVQLAEDGNFYIVSAEREITYGQIARFSDIKFSREDYDQLEDKDIRVGVNVYSGRKSSPDNLLDAEFYFDNISSMANKQFTLNGKLLYGDD